MPGGLCHRPLSQAYSQTQANALVRAAVRGDSDEIAELTATGADVNYLEPDAVPMLMWTLCAGNKQGFEALLKAGAAPDLTGTGHGRGSGLGDRFRTRGSVINEGWSATMMAAATPDPEFLRLALRYGANPNANAGQRTAAKPLIIAAKKGFLDNIKVLVAAGADVNEHDPQYSYLSAPQAAIAVGKNDIAVWLLEQGYSHDLLRLARWAEGRYVQTDSPQQKWKEQLITMLRARGMAFPASSLLKEEIPLRIIPQEDIEELIMGRKDFRSYPLKHRKRYSWETLEEYEQNLKLEESQK